MRIARAGVWECRFVVQQAALTAWVDRQGIVRWEAPDPATTTSPGARIGVRLGVMYLVDNVRQVRMDLGAGDGDNKQGG